MTVRDFLKPFRDHTELEIRMDRSILFEGDKIDICSGSVNCPSVQAEYYNRILDLYLAKEGAQIYGGGVLAVYVTEKECE